MRYLWIALFLWAPAAWGYPLPNLLTAPILGTLVASNDNSSTNITTSAYVELIAATARDISGLCISNTSSAIIAVATGAALGEVDHIYLPSGGAGCYPLFVGAGTRISLKALNATASTGYFIFTGF